jgi:hypothetical protein
MERRRQIDFDGTRLGKLDEDVLQLPAAVSILQGQTLGPSQTAAIDE